MEVFKQGISLVTRAAGICLLVGCFIFLVPGPSFAQSDPFFFTPGEDLLKKAGKFVYIKVETGKKQAFTGECIIATYRLYVAADIEGKMSKAPSYTGFASYDIEGLNSDRYEIEQINGIPFKVYLVKSVQLFGLRPGVQRLQPIELETMVRFKKEGKNNSLGNAGGDTLIPFTVRSQPVDIRVNTLPQPVPEGFEGAVGQFSFSARAGLPEIAEGRADTIQFLLEGAGNWHEVVLPALKWPEGLEVFEPFEKQNLDTYKAPLEGNRIVSYPVVAHKQGLYTIPPAVFTYFDPVVRKYISLRSGSIQLKVSAAVNNPSNDAEKEVAKDYTKIFSTIAIFLFPGIALVLVSLVIFRNKNKADRKKEGNNR